MLPPFAAMHRAYLFWIVLGVLFIPAAFAVFRIPEKPIKEMRPLAEHRYLRETSADHWPGQFERWLEDHYPGRSLIIQCNALVRHKWLEVPSSLVVVGRNGWLYFVGEGTVADWRGNDRFQPDELLKWRAALEGRSAWWRAHGAKYIAVFVPNKSTVYPEYFPQRFGPRQPGKLDQLVETLAESGSRVCLVDLRPVLAGVKSQRLAYWTTDSHWNDAGLRAACDAILDRAVAIGAATRASDATRWISSEPFNRDGDCVKLLRLSGLWPDHAATQLRLTHPRDLSVSESSIRQALRPKAFNRSSGHGRAVMIGDSFFRIGGMSTRAEAESPLILHFNRFVSLWGFEGTRDLVDYDDCVAIETAEHPTVVIEQWTERLLRGFPPDSLEFEQARRQLEPR